MPCKVDGTFGSWLLIVNEIKATKYNEIVHIKWHRVSCRPTNYSRRPHPPQINVVMETSFSSVCMSNSWLCFFCPFRSTVRHLMKVLFAGPYYTGNGISTGKVFRLFCCVRVPCVCEKEAMEKDSITQYIMPSLFYTNDSEWKVCRNSNI